MWLGENFNSTMLGFFQKEIFPMPIKIKITKHLKILMAKISLLLVKRSTCAHLHADFYIPYIDFILFILAILFHRPNQFVQNSLSGSAVDVELGQI